MIAQHRSLFSAWTTNVPGTKRRDSRRLVKRANICAVPARTSDASSAAPPCIGRCELAPTTAVRADAQAKYSKRFRAAYGHHRSRAGAPRHSSSPKSLAPRTDKPHHAGFPLTVTSLAAPNHNQHQKIPSFSTDSPPKPTCAASRHERRQEKHSGRRPLANRAKMCDVATRRPK